MEKKEYTLNKKTVVIAAVLALMVLFSAVQAVELSALKEKINTDLPAALAAAPSTTRASSPTNLQSNLENLPSMVGGC